MFGSIVFKFLGTLVVFIFSLVISLLRRQKIKTFSEIWRGSNPEEFIDDAGHEIKLILIGLISALFIAWRLSKIYLN